VIWDNVELWYGQSVDLQQGLSEQIMYDGRYDELDGEEEKTADLKMMEDGRYHRSMDRYLCTFRVGRRPSHVGTHHLGLVEPARPWRPCVLAIHVGLSDTPPGIIQQEAYMSA
jgi:hypothetical protein